MAEQPIIPETPLQRLILEQALALARQLEQAAWQAPDGQILDRCELAALDQGRQFLRDALAAAVGQRISEGEKRGRPPVAAAVDSFATTKATTPATS